MSAWPSTASLAGALFLLWCRSCAGENGTPPAAATPPANECVVRLLDSIIPSVEFTSAPLGEALEFLRARSSQLDPEKVSANVIALHPEKLTATGDTGCPISPSTQSEPLTPVAHLQRHLHSHRSAFGG